MRVLVTGKGSSGSWAIRGVQLGEAIGATVLPNAPLHVMRAHDCVIAVKRLTGHMAQDLKACGRPWAWDIVDSWPQPGPGNDWSEAQAKSWLASTLQAYRPSAVIAATKAMAEDVRAAGFRALALPHHHRPGLVPQPLRARVETIAYEGEVRWLGAWKAAAERAAASIGARLVVNGAMDLADAVLAVRDRTGYASRRWKSNVKLANAHALGIPFIAQPEAGYLETAAGGELWIESEAELHAAVRSLQDVELRKHFRAQTSSARLPLSQVASTYAAWISGNLNRSRS